MIEEKWRVTHSKDKTYNYHYRYNKFKVSEYVYSNRFEGIMVVYNYNAFEMYCGETRKVNEKIRFSSNN